MAAPEQEAGGQEPPAPLKIWDRATRATHWAFALLVPGSWITANAFDLLGVHMVLGYVTLGLVLFRVVWGLVGTRHARFASFLQGPGAVLRYARTLGQRDSQPSAGHNPLGALAICTMLAMLTLQAVTGLFASDELAYFGPYNGVISSSWAETINSIHKTNGQLIPWVIALHLTAICWYAAFKRQNLVGPMLTGRKSARRLQARDAIAHDRTALAIALAALAAAAVWALVALAPPPPMPDGLF